MKPSEYIALRAQVYATLLARDGETADELIERWESDFLFQVANRFEPDDCAAGFDKLMDQLGEHGSFFWDALSNLDEARSPMCVPNVGRPAAGTYPQEVREQWPIQNLNISKRVHNCLRAAGVSSVGEVVALKRTGLLRIPNISSGSVAEIEDALGSIGFRLRAR